MRDISKKFKISVCADGFVSLYSSTHKELKRRLGSALPVYSVDNMFVALELIERVCRLRPCVRPGKAGTSIEPKAPGWPQDYMHNEPDVSYELERIGTLFRNAHMRMLEELKAAG